jgi:glycosyltransferase involved in cell wall biosynthesis
MGTYASKNQAIRQCSGDFITFHDSDDWMHNQRLESHLNAMKHGVMCSTSSWIRMDSTGRIIVRRDGPYTHLNPASTFFRRSVFDQVGSFDSVRTGADSEILTRIRHRLGQSAVTHLPDVLAIGLHHEASLTQSGATAFDEHRYSPVRLEYTEAWVKWHLSVLTHDRAALNLNIHPEGRPFDIPPQIAP